MDENFHVKSRPENILAEKVVLACFFDRSLQENGAFGKLASNIDVSSFGVEGETGDENALEQLMRIFVYDISILECARFGLIRVADQIDGSFLLRLDEAPFHAARKSGSPASTQPRRFHFVDDVCATHRDR